MIDSKNQKNAAGLRNRGMLPRLTVPMDTAESGDPASEAALRVLRISSRNPPYQNLQCSRPDPGFRQIFAGKIFFGLISAENMLCFK